MYILDKLWNGEVHPAEYNPTQIEESAHLRYKHSQQIEQLLPMLDGAAQKLLDEITNTEIELRSMEEELCFRNGFQLAVKLILDGIAG